MRFCNGQTDKNRRQHREDQRLYKTHKDFHEKERRGDKSQIWWDQKCHDRDDNFACKDVAK